MPRHFLIAIFVLFIISLQSQSTFHRGYPFKSGGGIGSDTSIVNLKAIQLKDKKYLSLDGVKAVNDAVYTYLLLVNYDEKGTMEWVRTIKLNDSSLRIAHGFSSLFQSSNDSIYFTFTLNNGNFRKVIGAIKSDGTGLWTKVLSRQGNQTTSINKSNPLIEGKDSFLYNITNYDLPTGQDRLYVKSDRNGNVTTQNLLFHSTGSPTISLEPKFTSIAVENDSTILINGNITFNNEDTQPFFEVWNPNQTVKFSKYYDTDSLKNKSRSSVTQSLKVGDGYILTGSLNFADSNNYKGIFVIKTDLTGKTVWSKKMNAAVVDSSFVTGITLGSDNNLYIAGNISLTDSSLAPFIVSLNPNGVQRWFNVYSRAKGLNLETGSIFKTQDEGLAFFTTDIDNISSKKTKISFIKTDLEGKTTCEVKKEINLFVDQRFFDFVIQSTKEENIIPVSNNILPSTNEGGAEKITVPILSLNSKEDYCPNEPINFLFDPEVEGAVAYKWNDGSTLDTLRAFTTGEYSVTVTVDDKYCFMLCDTGKLERIKLPSVSFTNLQKVCENTDFEIIALGSDGKKPYTYAWSGGTVSSSSGNSIKSKILGTYSVTLTDACNEKSIASIEIDESIWFNPPSVATAVSILSDTICEGGDIRIVAQGTTETGAELQYKWSTGETLFTIVGQEGDTYSVTVTDVCGNTASSEITPKGNIYYSKIPIIKSLKQSSNDFCNTGGITLSVIAYRSSESLSLASIKWSTGQTTLNDTISTIVVNETGKYSVTVTDVCNLSKSLEFDAVKPNNTVDSCVQFPTLFLPGTRGIMMSPDSASLTLDNYFGAFSACSLNTDSLSIEKLNLKEFEMRVFNRWGKEVFTSTDPLKRWEGKLEDGDQEYYPSDVYLWVSKYKIGEFCTSSRKGNVTLIK